MKGLEIFARSLILSGVDFCVLAQARGLEDVSRAFAGQGIETLVPVSETAAMMIADGYARAGRRPGVVVSRGEIAKLITGTTSAWADKTPLLLFSIVPKSEGDSSAWSWRKVDFKEVFKPITRFQARVSRAQDIPELLVRSFREAVSLRGGPVFLEIEASALEEESQFGESDFERIAEMLKRAPDLARPCAAPEQIEQALALLGSASRPLIFSGGGVFRSGAAEELNRLAELLRIPIISSMGGMGSAFASNPCYVGPPSYLAGEAFHAAIKYADVVLAAGCVFSGLDGFGLPPLWSKSIRFIQVNIDPEHIGFNPRAELAILGDLRLVISQMLDRAKGYAAPASREKWVAKLRRLNREHRERIIDEAGRNWKKIHPASLVLELSKFTTEIKDYYVVLDGGNTCLWAGMLVDLPGPGRGFFPTGMGTLGSGLPMAMGVKRVAGDAKVLLLSGDGSFLYNVQEFETLRKYKIPLVTIIFNDSAWNMIRAGQMSSYGEVYGTDLPESDYAAVARSFGCFGVKVRKKEEIAGAIREALASKAPAVVDVDIDVDSIPDSLISFALVEFEGAPLSMKGTLKSILSGRQKLDVRLWNQVKYIFKNFR